MKFSNYISLLSFILIGCICSGQVIDDARSNLDMSEAGDLQDTATAIGNNGFQFEAFQTGINSKYADYGIGFYREKFLSYSARKIGALGKKDPLTNEPYTKLYCSEISYEYDLNRPNLFSHILNKNDNLGSLSFSKDGSRVYFTKSEASNSQIFQLYSADMNPKREGEFINIEPLPFNDPEYSFENPHLSEDGTILYFAANLPDAIGGFDIFYVNIQPDGSYGKVERVEGSVNTVLDEKFPHTSLDGKYLYFSSKGHGSLGGFDVFRSRKANLGYVATRNLGNTINTPQDEIAYIPATETVGYITSNRSGGQGSYDIYKITEFVIDQTAEGIVTDYETGIPLENATVVLVDAEGTEVATVNTDTDGRYSFPIDSFLDYTLLALKEGFESNSASLETNTNLVAVFETDISLKATPAEIVKTKEKSYLKIDNIQFDFNSAAIKDISTITLNTVYQTLISNPEIKVAINAHTDQKGSPTYNQRLSEKRAAAAMNYLIEKGISKDRLIAKGYGESQPLYDCNACSDEQNEANRRIEFVIITETN